MGDNAKGRIHCSYCKLDMTLVDISKLNNKCPRCRSGLFTQDNIPYGIEARTAPRYRSAATPPNRQRGNLLMPDDRGIPSQ